MASDQVLTVCPECGCRDLFVRKRFPQKIGVAVIGVAGILFIILAALRRTFYLGLGILVGVTILDLLISFLVGRTTQCYRCRKEFPQAPINPRHHDFDLATAEKYRR